VDQARCAAQANNPLKDFARTPIIISALGYTLYRSDDGGRTLAAGARSQARRPGAERRP